MEDKQLIPDKDLKDLLKGFKPELSSDDSFLKNLDKRLETVDLVKEHTQSLRHKNYIALGVAFLAGLFVGLGLSLLFPFVIEWSLNFFTPSPSLEVNPFNFEWVNFDWRIIGWILIAVTCIFTAKNAYDITLYKLSSTESKRK